MKANIIHVAATRIATGYVQQDQAKAMELKKLEMKFPDEWEMEPSQNGSALQRTISSKQVMVPKEGLFEVPHDSPEYWDFVENFFWKKPDPQNARKCPKTGIMSDTKGLHDAWVTKLQRIQNSDLYTYYDSQLTRVGRNSAATDPKTGQVRETMGWHGTGGFPAENIYNDRQDGCASVTWLSFNLPSYYLCL